MSLGVRCWGTLSTLPRLRMYHLCTYPSWMVRTRVAESMRLMVISRYRNVVVKPVSIRLLFLIFHAINIPRRVSTTQCKRYAPEIGEGGQNILAVRLEEEDSNSCKIVDQNSIVVNFRGNNYVILYFQPHCIYSGDGSGILRAA